MLLVAGICIAAAIVRHNANSPASLLVAGTLYCCYFMAMHIRCVRAIYYDTCGKVFAG